MKPLKIEQSDDPIQIDSSQLQNKKKPVRRSKTSEVDNAADKRKNLSTAKLKKKQMDRELWIRLQTQNRY